VAGQFVGRRAELARMHEAWRSALAGTPGVLVVAGGSGAGKTALMERFIQEAGPHRVVSPPPAPWRTSPFAIQMAILTCLLPGAWRSCGWMTWIRPWQT
jgi:molybdopterin biosynthesis enzyme